MITIRQGEYVSTGLERRAVSAVLRRGRLSPDGLCRKFEDAFAAHHGAKYGLFVNSGTDALRIAVATLKEQYGWKDGDKIICPATTFVATINVVLQNNLVPLLVDNGFGGFNTDRMTHFFNCTKGEYFSGVRAIMPVHLCGKRPDPTKLLAISKANGWKIIEDSCECMGVGPVFGDVACYSTYVCHILTTGVGGLAVTNNRRTHDLMRSYANHGRDVRNIPGYRDGPISSRFKYDRIGYSSRATEMQAAIGLAQLKTLPWQLARRFAVAEDLRLGLMNFWTDLEVPPFAVDDAFMMFPLLVKGEVSRVNRDKLCQFLEDNGIETRPLMPILNQPCYKDAAWIERASFSYPAAERMIRDGFYIPCHPGMDDKDTAHIIKTFKRYLTK